jgi:hypothetical protein
LWAPTAIGLHSIRGSSKLVVIATFYKYFELVEVPWEKILCLTLCLTEVVNAVATHDVLPHSHWEGSGHGSEGTVTTTATAAVAYATLHAPNAEVAVIQEPRLPSQHQCISGRARSSEGLSLLSRNQDSLDDLCGNAEDAVLHSPFTLLLDFASVLRVAQ